MTTPELSTFPTDLPVLRRGDAAYADAAHTLLGDGDPELVVQPRDAADVAAAVQAAQENQLPLTVRAGGHSMNGSSLAADGLLVDLRSIADIEVDPATRIVRIGGGATWGTVAQALQPYGLGITAGDTAGVGVGGLTLGGGIGWMVRRHGLAIDSLIGAQVVTADSEILEVSAEAHPDLFWSLRGGGPGIGVVTRFDFRAQQVTDVVFGTIMVDLRDPAELLAGWRDVQRGADERLTSVLSLVPAMGGRPPMAMVQVCFDGPEADAQEYLDRLLAVGPVLSSDFAVQPYAEVLDDEDRPPGVRVAVTSSFLDLDDAALDALGTLVAGGGAMVAVRALGGAMARTAVEETAFAQRSAEAMVVALRFLPEEQEEGDDLLPGWHAVAELGGGAYINFSSASAEVLQAAAYPPATRERLARIRAEHDPAGVFGAAAGVEDARDSSR